MAASQLRVPTLQRIARVAQTLPCRSWQRRLLGGGEKENEWCTCGGALAELCCGRVHVQKRMNLTKTIRKLPITQDGQRAGYYVHDDLSSMDIKYDEPSVRLSCPRSSLFVLHV